MATKDVTDRMVCEAYAEAERQRGPDRRHDYAWPYDLLMQRTGECFKVCYRAMERASDRGFIEYGVSLRTGWLTDQGRELLRPGEPCKHPGCLSHVTHPCESCGRIAGGTGPQE